jgi:hypothetical protein
LKGEKNDAAVWLVAMRSSTAAVGGAGAGKQGKKAGKAP